MFLPAFAGKPDLPFPFLETPSAIIGPPIMAVGTADSFFVVRTAPVRIRNRHAACMAQAVHPLLKSMSHRNALVENKAFALPQRTLFRHLFQIVQNPPSEMVYLVKSKLLQIGC